MNLNQLIVSASQISQRCQRNWNVDTIIDNNIINTLKEVVKNSPTKQNEEYYSVEFITDRNVIENVYQTTSYDDTVDTDETKNPQTLANLIVVFFAEFPKTFRNPKHEYEDNNLVTENINTSIGIVSGQVALSAAMLGLKTGFCACFNRPQLSKILNKENPKLILGVGYPDANKDRLEHHKIKVFSSSYEKPVKIFHAQTIDELAGVKPSIKLEYFPPILIPLEQSVLVLQQQEGEIQSAIVNISEELSLILLEMDLITNIDQRSIVLSVYADDIIKLEQFKSKLIEYASIKEFHSRLTQSGWALKF